jgi:presenilin-like A22 family membrane protease
MEEPTLLYMLSPFLVVAGIIAAILLAWVLHTRPSWWQVRQELYGLLYWVGAVVVFIAFLLFAFSYLPGPDWLWYVVGFVGFFWMCFLIHEKFGSSRI